MKKTGEGLLPLCCNMHIGSNSKGWVFQTSVLIKDHLCLSQIVATNCMDFVKTILTIRGYLSFLYA